MALDLGQAIAQYGTLGLLANSIPELRAKLEQGASQEWTPDKFWAEIQQTGWWKGSSETRRQATILQTTDPASWAQTLQNQTQKVTNWVFEMGVGNWTPEQLRQLAEQSLLTGMDEQSLRNAVGRFGAWSNGTEVHGAAADLDAKIRGVYASQGIGYTDSSVRTAVNEILGGYQSLGTYENLAREQAKTKYPTLAAQLDAGLSVKDVASPYIAAMAQTLEINENDVDLSDNYIQRALTDRDEKGGFRTKPLWAFERELKDDPRWDQTKNAHNQTYDMLSRIGADWGFSAG